MKKVMLIGDSIRLSYQPRVAELHKDHAVIEGPGDNCRFAAYTLFNLSAWLTDDHYDAIHWNNGLWDVTHMPDGKIHTPLASYLESQERIVRLLRKKTKHLVYATTTPVWPEQFSGKSLHPRRNEEIAEYNEAVVHLLTGYDVVINDLHASVSKNIKSYVSTDMIHLSEEGIELCAQQVAACVVE
jgi:hypothetical protein